MRWALPAALILVACSSTPAIPPAPPLPATAESTLPTGWALSSPDIPDYTIREDLNGDGRKDLLAFVKKERARALALVESKGDGFRLYMSRVDLEPRWFKFDAAKRVIVLEYEEGGTGGSDRLTAKFRHQNGDYFLIGTTHYVERNSPNCNVDDSCSSDETDVNYATGYSVYTSWLGSKVDAKEKKKIKFNPPVRLKDFRAGDYFNY